MSRANFALRIASILRRAKPRAAPGPVTQVRFGDFCFDLDRGELRQRDEVIRLTDREREMLRLLAEHAGEIVPREALAGSGVAGNERTVDVQVNRLRRKIERDPANPLHLQTARGAGYRLLGRSLERDEEKWVCFSGHIPLPTEMTRRAAVDLS